MADDGPQPIGRYSAFISYNRHDARFSRRLHRWLESYRLPKRLAASTGRPRLKPVFRDAEEMTAAADLSDAVREAIAQSDYLVVVCSPAGAQSQWVGREIDFFRALHGDAHILAALIEGTSQTAFHPALLKGVRGQRQPLAADFRREGPGPRLAKLKLVSALAGVGLDELVHRDAQRRNRRLMASAVGALAGVALVAVLSTLMFSARTDAERQRREATGLVGYMVGDLRKALKPVSPLDQLAVLDERALAYYRTQDLSHLSDEALRQRAKLLQAAGDDNERQGKIAAARARFEEAHRTTAQLLAERPDDPQRIFAHAQSEYWVGFINWRAGDAVAARRGLEAYAALARKLVALDPANPDYRHEVAYSELNLGTLVLREDGDGAGAARHFAPALAVLQQLSNAAPTDAGLTREIADAHAWLADSRRIDGDIPAALRNRRLERQILERLAAARPQDLEIRNDLLGNELAIARIYIADGQTDRALRQLQRGRAEAAALERIDPSNVDITKQARMLELFEVSAWLGAPAARRPAAAVLARSVGDCTPSAPALADDEIRDFCRILDARVRSLTPGAPTTTLPTPTVRYSKRWGLDMVHEHDLLKASLPRPAP